MKKLIITLTVFAAFSFSVFADSQAENMPTFAGGYDKQNPTPGFTYKPASEHTAKANRELKGIKKLLKNNKEKT